ncbi:hypothetical protein ANO11243_092850 [Dothideomycetidae sp. 11243]|nr:hypothetical protein ANO11243_092850 [fungal sp. No.11243]
MSSGIRTSGKEQSWWSLNALKHSSALSLSTQAASSLLSTDAPLLLIDRASTGRASAPAAIFAVSKSSFRSRRDVAGEAREGPGAAREGSGDAGGGLIGVIGAVADLRSAVFGSERRSLRRGSMGVQSLCKRWHLELVRYGLTEKGTLHTADTARHRRRGRISASRLGRRRTTCRRSSL